MPPYYPSWQGTIWQSWVNATTLPYQPMTTSGTTNVWNVWVNQAQQTTSGAYYPPQLNAQQYTWNVWQAQPTYTIGTNPVHTHGVSPAYATPAPRELTEAERTAVARQGLIAANRQRARFIRRKMADKRAEDLLVTHLSEQQREQWSKDKSFTVVTADGAREYRIKRGTAGNITLVKCEGDAPMSKHGRPLRVGSRFCMHVYHPEGWVPDDDNVLAQKLLLESGGESEFLQLANVS